MRCLKIISCIMLIFFAAVSTSGCRGGGELVKGAIKSVGKTTKKVPNVVKRHADDVAEIAVDMATTNNNPQGSTRPTAGKAPVSRAVSATKAGAVVAGGAMVANEFQTGALNAKDLSLGTLTMDDRAEKVKEELGNPDSVTTDSDGGKRLKYDDAEVVVFNGKISALVSASPALYTARGIHEGSSAQEVFDRYGTDYQKSSYDKQTLYEYSITSADGHPSLLRFAVNNSDGKVAYISERLVQRESESKNNSTGNSAEQTFRNYHKAITDGNYREAYEILSFKQRERMGNFDSYVAGFSNTISSEVSDLRLVSSDGDVCTFDYTLTARDRAQGNRIKVATFKGQVTMAKDKGKWYVRHAKSEKVNERYE